MFKTLFLNFIYWNFKIIPKNIPQRGINLSWILDITANRFALG